MMTAKEIVKKTEELFNKRDRAGFLALHHPEVELTTPAGQTLKGPEAALSFGWAFIEGFPDARLTTSTSIAEGDLVAAEMTLEGTHTATLKDPAGIMPPVPATGKRLVLKTAAILREKDGLAKEVRLYADNMALMAQLGLLPAPAKA
jgi:predicted ester cyclase